MKSLTKGLIKVSKGKDSLHFLSLTIIQLLAKFICTKQRSQVVGTVITAHNTKGSRPGVQRKSVL